MRLVFSRFLPEQVVDQVLADGDIESLLAARRLTGTVMFTDLRGFTTFAENSPVEIVVDVLNRYLGEVTDAVLDEGGTLVGYLGDGVIAAFGAPIESSDHADRALRAAREIVGPRIESFNQWLVKEKQISRRFKTGVGLNSGPLMSGNVGSERRLEYTVIGDTINTAARVEAMTKDLRVRHPPDRGRGRRAQRTGPTTSGSSTRSCRVAVRPRCGCGRCAERRAVDVSAISLNAVDGADRAVEQAAAVVVRTGTRRRRLPRSSSLGSPCRGTVARGSKWPSRS